MAYTMSRQLMARIQDKKARLDELRPLPQAVLKYLHDDLRIVLIEVSPPNHGR